MIASKSLSPRKAVLMSAFFNTLPVVTGSSAVANTVSSLVALNKLEVVPDGAVPMGVRVACGALLAAILWNLATLHYGIPSSSSHALLGGLLGAGLAAGGIDVITWAKVQSAAIAIVASPALAGAVAMLLSFCLKRMCMCMRLSEDHALFRVGLIASACALSWSHGQNDAQKTMGVLAAALYSAGYLSSSSAKSLQPPLWVMLSAFAAIGLGTALGGFAIIETVALKLTRIGRASGMAANIGSITAIEGATALAIPISTTQAATAAVAGSGVGWGAGLQWRTLARLMVAWIITLPCATAAGYVGFWIMMIPSWGAPAVALVVLLGLGAWTAYMVIKHTSASQLQAEVAAARAADAAAATDGGSAATAGGTPAAKGAASAAATDVVVKLDSTLPVAVAAEAVAKGGRGDEVHVDGAADRSHSGSESDASVSISSASHSEPVCVARSHLPHADSIGSGLDASGDDPTSVTIPVVAPVQAQPEADGALAGPGTSATRGDAAPVTATAADAGGALALAASSPGLSPAASPLHGAPTAPPQLTALALARGWSPVSASGTVAEGDSFLVSLATAPASGLGAVGTGSSMVAGPHALLYHDRHDGSAFQPRGGVHVHMSESLPSSSAASVATDGRSVSRASVCTDVSDAASEAPLRSTY